MADIIKMNPALTDNGEEFIRVKELMGYHVVHKHSHEDEKSDVMVVILVRDK